MRILLLIGSILTLAACTTMTYTSTIDQQGRWKQKSCINGKCHTLIGPGNIQGAKNEYGDYVVYVQCRRDRNPVVYDYDELKGYDCYKDEPIY